MKEISTDELLRRAYTPWKIVPLGDGLIALKNAMGRTVADNETYYPQAIDEDEAELIRRAVNSFEAMREALNLMLRDAPHPTKNVKKEYHYLVSREAAKKAIALAEGKEISPTV